MRQLTENELSLLSIAFEIAACRFDSNAVEVANREVSAIFTEQARQVRDIAMAFAEAGSVRVEPDAS